MSEMDEICMVPVPRRHLNVVYSTLARVMASTSRLDVQDDGNDVERKSSRSGTLPFQNRNGIVWTDDNLAKLRKGIRCPAPIKMLDMTAAQPGRPIYFEDVRQALDQKDSTTRVQIGTLTKAIRRDFGVSYDDANWPVKIDWDAENGMMRYVMDDEVAAAWNRIREHESES